MKNPRRIDFTFIFDGADSIWPSISVFESDITKFLKDKGIEASMIKSVDGQSGRYTLFLSKIEVIQNMPQRRPLPPGKQIDNIRKQIGRK